MGSKAGSRLECWYSMAGFPGIRRPLTEPPGQGSIEPVRQPPVEAMRPESVRSAVAGESCQVQPVSRVDVASAQDCAHLAALESLAMPANCRDHRG